MILCSDPHAQYLEHRDAIDTAISKVLQSGRYILGPECEAFEDEFAEFTGTKYCSGVASGTDALLLALRACGIGEGDEVITVSMTASATLAAIRQSGATAVYVDISPETYTLDANKLEQCLSSRAKAIVPVHLYGHPAAIQDIVSFASQNNLYVIEDCAQAHGALFDGKPVGSFGDLGCFSFYPTKNLGAIGDGGAVVTNNRELADKVRLLREYGWEEKFNSSIHGWNSRLDEVQAAILRVKLKHLPDFNSRRSGLAEEYRQQMSDLALVLPTAAANSQHAYHLFVVRSDRRDKLLAHLESEGILAGIHYPLPTHKQEAYSAPAENLSITERYSREILSLPMYPELGKKVNEVCTAVRKFFENQ